MHERERLQTEYDTLPDWAKRLLDTLRCQHSYGICRCPSAEAHDYKKRGVTTYTISFWDDESEGFFKALCDALDVAKGMSAPMPGEYDLASMSSPVNVVEMAAGNDDSAFDQPCAFGHRVEDHAVYCHNSAWSDSPRKCRRTWYTGGKTRDEDCPGFVPNPHSGAGT